eukprot:TRINITY_DN7083_c0_g1_i1.p1 TRINITY_DN7083_c0_g1~~TRINITY_DN7083_c0_g1_i1.p1  ORF type:complete len:318 (+),score=98.58 TRINITY_DN7083_c0_g1_i1:62-955(+)
MSSWFSSKNTAAESSTPPSDDNPKAHRGGRRSTAHDEEGEEEQLRMLRRERENNKKLQIQIEQLKEQFAALERKHLELTRHLSDKAEENSQLFEEKKALKMKVNELSGLEKKNEQLQKEIAEKTEVEKELIRRLETSGKSLTDMAREVMSLRDQHSPHTDRVVVENPIIQDQRAQITRLERLLEEEKQMTKSYDESTEEYEKTIKRITAKMKAHSKREIERRRQAEFEGQRLKQKVEELEFLLEQRQPDYESWSSSGEEEEDEVKQEEPAPVVQEVKETKEAKPKKKKKKDKENGTA